jgi:hypothetical protein
MRNGRSDIIDITVEIRSNDPKRNAVAVFDGQTDENGREVWIWLPRSQIEIAEMDGRTVEVSLPEWLALTKELI